MKNLLKLFLGTVFLCAHTASIAADQSDCLPISQVAKAQFSRASGTFLSSSKTLWIFTSLPIIDHDRSWTVVFTTVLSSIEKSVFTAGENEFHKTPLIGPGMEEKGGKLVCQYATSSNGVNSVFAVSPAVD